MSNQAYNGIYGVRADAAAIAAHETSQAAMLDQMRERLAALTEEARSIRAQMPNEFGPDVERIQQQMQRLGERLSDLGRGALVPYNLADLRSARHPRASRRSAMSRKTTSGLPVWRRTRSLHLATAMDWHTAFRRSRCRATAPARPMRPSTFAIMASISTKPPPAR